MKNETVLYVAGDPVDRVYFPHSGIISLVVELSGGQGIGAAMIGRDSVLGATAALDGQVSLNKAIVQLPGGGETLDVGRFVAIFGRSGPGRSRRLIIAGGAYCDRAFQGRTADSALSGVPTLGGLRYWKGANSKC